jgi:hypothetical protein
MSAAVLALALGVVFGVFAVGGASKNRCSLYGPAPAGALITERSDAVTEQRSWWPIGTVCEWERADGTGTIRSVTGDVGETALVYGLLIAGCGLAAAAGRVRVAPARR